MTLAPTSGVSAGERLFARYAHAPNALGYCGPAAAHALQLAACGSPSASSEEVRRAARQFSGAWPYQQLIGELTGLDPLSEEVGRSYWTGSSLPVDVARFGELLLERFGSQAGHYWTHLTPALLKEATSTHIFHVLGVYPWTRLLPTGAEPARQVLDGCRIRVGEVISVSDQLTVLVDTLTWDGVSLGTGAPAPEQVAYRTEDGTFLGSAEEGVVPGDLVAVHWGFACDRLTVEQAASLQDATVRQVELTNQRLG